MASRLLAVADSRSWDIGARATGDRGDGRRDTGDAVMVSPGLGVALPRKRSLELTFTDRIMDGIEGSQAGWSAAMADGLQLLSLNPLRGTTDGAPKFRGAGAVGPLALGQNRAW